jgi:uncharacterized protein
MIFAAARALLLAAVVCGLAPASAQVAVPPLSTHITDQTGTLDAQQQARLEQTLADFESRKGSQLAVLIVRTTAPESVEQYALRVAQQWKLGRKKIDDGAVLVVAKDDRALRIEVGYGLEGALNDATSKRIIEEVIAPRFRQDDFAGGISQGIDGMIRVIDGEPLPAPEPERAQSAAVADGVSAYLPVIVVLALVLGSALRALFGRLPGAMATGGLVGVVVWWLAGALSVAFAAGVMALLFTLFGGMGLLRAGGLGGRGRGGSSGRGGGGFTGGGGGFGGGGASGKW